QRGEAIAVEYQGEQVSYGELNRRANQMAHDLGSMGAGPEVVVGICLERSIEMVVAVLAVLKAGAAYLPLDASYPLERLSFMLESSHAPILLTQESLLGRLPASWARVLCVDEEEQRLG